MRALSRFTRLARLSRHALAAALLAATAGLTACGSVSDLVAPGTKGFAPARLALSATVPALQQLQQGGVAALRVSATYERADGSQVPLSTQTFPLTSERTQDVPVPIDLGACLNDAQRRAATGEGACVVRLSLTLLLDDRVLDTQAIGPFVLQPGATLAAPAAVTLYEVRTVRVDLPTGSVTRPDGSLRLEVGASATLSAAALDPSGGTVAGRTARWTSATPAVATVNEQTGVVTAVAPGTARITASIGGRDASVDVAVVPRASPVTIVAGGSGSGTIVSTPAGLSCRVVNGQTSGTCTFSFAGDAQVSLVATADPGSGFVGWSDACATAGTATTCVVTADQARSARATFGVLRTLVVGGAGDGAGAIGSTPGGIACTVGATGGGSCSAQFLEGTTVTLTASPATGNTFVGWSGDCAAASGPTCTLTISSATRSATARFARPQALSVELAGSGDGSVGGSVGGTAIACVRRDGATSGTCSATAPLGTVVTLSASPDANSTFTGWTGACSGTGPCTVTVDQARTVGATFTRRQVTLTVAVSGAGAGTVVVDGQRCTLAAGAGSQTCTLRVDVGRALALTAEVGTASEFTGWSGACAASARSPSCSLTLSGDGSVGATFVPGAVRITIVGESNTTGGGTVGTTDGRLACTISGANATGTCDALVAIGTTLTLNASPDPRSTFGSWSGACAGTAGPTCSFTVRTAASVGARFLRQQVSLTVGVGGSGAGTVSLNGSAFCTLGPTQGTNACTRLVDAGAPITLTMAPASGSTATWGGPCANAPVTGPCTFTATGTSVSVPVSFALTGMVSVRPVAGYTGGGVVRSSDQRIDCTIAPLTGAISGTCDAVYATGSTVSLSLVSHTMEIFAGAWSGLCTSSGPTCTFTAPAAGGTARIALPEFVDVDVSWTGAGSVATAFGSSAGQLLSCDALPGTFHCSAFAPEGSTITFTATPQWAGGFQGWTDGCAAAGTALVCTRTIPFRTSGNPPYVVGARFAFEAVVDVSGGGTVALQGVTGPNTACTNSGTGTITCSLHSPTRTATLVATPASGNVLTGWGTVACITPTATCTVDVTAANGRISATFASQGPVGLEFDRDSASTGEGRVITSFGTCNLPLSGRNGACSEVAPVGATRSYTAQPFSGSQFVSWGGPCAGQTGTTCTLSPVTVGGTITARFDLTATQLLTLGGINSITPGTGTMTTSPAGTPAMSCTVTGNAASGTCSATYAVNANVSITPTPAAGSVFSAWSGACTGSVVPCVVPMNGPKTVNALFVPSTSTLRLAFDAQSAQRGFLTTNVGLSCSDTPENQGLAGNGCAPTGGAVTTGTSVTVTASGQLPGSGFVGWTGSAPCAGVQATTCTFTMSSDVTVTGRFGSLFNPTLEVQSDAGSGGGTVSMQTIRNTTQFSQPGFGVNQITLNLFSGDVVRFTATATGAAFFQGWEGDCASFGTNPVCTLSSTFSLVRARFNGGSLNRRPAPPSGQRSPVRP
ncbi:InlB B-repeat-containing protein [Roseisolibacter agri]|uniref:BIG2 domain-containing protein n=1 Tax=Roseisolibacter agri TaxID=2014610 RepID=A0AA37Q5G3_9BACT|nr:Ig-like domain-containing protein [Roseisolibacter agri]GLC24997.1 hypothetical protein rosag_15100 [Roseisolibacter agri]